MKLSCDMYTESWKDNPSYRIFVNGELMAERVYFVPKNEKGHYRYHNDLDLPAGDNAISIQGINAEFTLGKLYIEDKPIEHEHGVFNI